MKVLGSYAASLSLATIATLIGGRWLASETDGGYTSEYVVDALDDFPRQIGEGNGIWIAVRDVQIPSSQERMLDLAAYVSIEYRRIGTNPPVLATLFIAYCPDARTMSGHHPPHCYPASGWTMHENETVRSAVVRKDSRVVEYSVYRFQRNPTRDLDLTVVNGFFAHPGVFKATLEEAAEHIGPVFFGRKGLFQFQILFQGLSVEVDVTRYADELIRGIPSSVFDITFGRSESDTAVGEKVRGVES